MHHAHDHRLPAGWGLCGGGGKCGERYFSIPTSKPVPCGRSFPVRATTIGGYNCIFLTGRYDRLR